jgi:DNA polymerase I
MIEAFNNDLDIHKLTAANVFNVSLEKVTPEMRRLAKTLNFGVIFGMGAVAFAKTGGISIGEARKFIEEYFNDFKKVKEWHERIKSEARTLGYVTNLNGRRRWMLSATSMFRGEAAEAERAAINMPIQGLDADIMKIAMVKIAKEIKKRKWENEVRMLLTIHDELLFEIKEDIIKEAAELIKKIMEGVYELEVPIRVVAKIGRNWGELE